MDTNNKALGLVGKKNNTALLLAVCSVLSGHVYADIQVQGKVQLSALERGEGKSWLNHGWSNQRFDKNSDGLVISRAWLDTRFDVSRDLSVHSSVQYVPDPDDKLGITEAYVLYQPLINSDFRWNVKAGAFYPEMSMENPQFGWSSPYTYSFSGINAWLGEEIRTFGSEFVFEYTGKRQRSPHAISFHGALFKGNDPAGTMLAWRGFANHDRQSMLNESIYYPPVRSLNEPQLRFQAPHVEPFSEVDGKWGYYLGVHWDYNKQAQLKVYWYDNQGDPSKINYSTGQYAWDTRFISVGGLYKFDKDTRLIAQWLNGATAMGTRRGVDTTYSSAYLMVHHRVGQHRVSARIEHSHVDDHDSWQFDPNASQSKALTFTYKFQFDEHWQSGLEWLYQRSDVDNRAAAQLPATISESQWRFVSEYTF